MGPWKEVKTRPALDETVERLTEATATAVDRYTPDLRPTPYSKRWFTPVLKIQQTEVNHLRRKWQESCAELGRHDARSITLFQEMQQKRRIWTRTIEKVKATNPIIIHSDRLCRNVYDIIDKWLCAMAWHFSCDASQNTLSDRHKEVL